MGLIKELFTELIDLPESAATSIDLERDLVILDYNAKYTIVNLFFQILDCLVIPYFTLVILNGNLDFIKMIIVLVLGFSAVFSIFQTLYFLFKPTNKYVSFYHQLLGETALGILFASFFNIQIKHYIK
jgi:hypothetical protein